MQPFAIFKSGSHTTMAGQTIEFTADDIAGLISSYDPAVSEAPLVKGHPQTDDPAQGWVASLSEDRGLVVATPRDVSPAFAEEIQAGRYRKRSASLYPPAHPANPKPGSYYLKHVGWLGAVPPAVKGMPDPEFASDQAEGLLVFAADYPASQDAPGTIDMATTKLGALLARLMQSKDKTTEDLGKAAGIDAGTVSQILRGDIERPPERRLAGFARVLGVSLQSLQDALPATTQSNTAKSLSEEPSMTPEEIKAQQDQLAADQAAFAERERALDLREQNQRQAQISEFVEGLVASGRILPRSQEGMVAYLASLDDGELVFGESGDAYKGTRSAFMQDFLSSLPEQIDYSERSRPEQHTDTAQVAAFAVPDGYQVDAAQLKRHNAALAYQSQHDGVSYTDALARVEHVQ